MTVRTDIFAFSKSDRGKISHVSARVKERYVSVELKIDDFTATFYLSNTDAARGMLGAFPWEMNSVHLNEVTLHNADLTEAEIIQSIFEALDQIDRDREAEQEKADMLEDELNGKPDIE